MTVFVYVASGLAMPSKRAIVPAEPHLQRHRHFHRRDRGFDQLERMIVKVFATTDTWFEENIPKA